MLKESELSPRLLPSFSSLFVYFPNIFFRIGTISHDFIEEEEFA
jgi:hypothetical protein